MSGRNQDGLFLSKKERGRLKKLLKRAIHNNCSSCQTEPVSGILTVADWNEVQQLLRRRQQQQQQVDGLVSSACSIGPSMSWREGCTQASDASDHRDLLFRLLLQQQQQQQQDETIKWPRWASLHNPAAVERAAVLELHVANAAMLSAVVSAIEAMIATKNENINKNNNNLMVSCLCVPTRWHANLHHPTSASNGLLYHHHATTATTPRKRKKPSDSNTETTNLNRTMLHDVYEALLPLALTQDELAAEGYPMQQQQQQQQAMTDEPSAVASNNVVKDKEGDSGRRQQQHSNSLPLLPLPFPIRHPKDVRKEDAPSVIQYAQVHMPDDDDDDDETRLPPFVSVDQTPKSTSTSTINSSFHDSSPRIFAMDCEMVQTTAGTELARVTLLQLTGVRIKGQDINNSSLLETKIIMDQLVRPRHAVMDYLTQYSGITAELLQTADETGDVVELEQVQASLLYWLSSSSSSSSCETPTTTTTTSMRPVILIGHSLENDLRAVRLLHAPRQQLFIVDTAILFRAIGAKFKYSLRHLAATLLHKRIRTNNNNSNDSGHNHHCSREDAETALALAVRRARDGPSFGIHNKTQCNLLQQLATTTNNGINNEPVVCIGPVAWLQEHVLKTNSGTSIHALACESLADRNRQAVAAWLSTKTSSSSSTKKRARLVWANWKLGTTTENNDKAIKEEEEHQQLVLNLLEDLLGKISPTTVVVVVLQAGYEQAVSLTQQRKIRLNPRTTMGWTEQDQNEWLRTVHACRNGTVLWIGTKQQEEREES